MIERPDTDSDAVNARPKGAAVSASDVKQWFIREVLPLEAALMQYLQHNWRNRSDIADLQQEVYLRVYRAAQDGLPERPRQFVFATARNLLVDRVRHQTVVPIEAMADLEALETAADNPGPDRVTEARDELRHMQNALDRLPPQCRQVVVLARIEGLSRREIADRMGLAEPTVANYLARGIRILVDILLGEDPGARRLP
jgi:RNA polymerase sigma-70 factor (ECF subfamily)